ncbi:MAG TPA: ankyrin repeat domain-containing protein [Steroidobacteraceae bacterium]|nr:ankyrin repeat domain-containing protein [Steroidobacteraceae bacterium]
MRGLRRTSFAPLAAVAVLALLVGGRAALAASAVADAVMQQDAARLQALLRAHADVNAAQPDGSTALHWAAYYGDPHTAAALIAAGAHPNVRTDTGMTPLTLACQSGNAALVKSLLDGGADVGEVLASGETPLMMAARTGSVPVIKLLLAHGAKIDARERLRGTTALMWAAANGNTDAVRLLIAHGADVSLRSGTTAPGRKPYLAETGRSRISQFAFGYGLAGVTVLQKSAASRREVQEQIQAARAVLERYPLPKLPPASKTRWGGLTPLIFATRQGDFATVKALLAAGADVNETSEFDWSPLLVATQNKYYRIGEYLLKHGANPNIANGGGWTPLYIATDNRNIEGGDYPVRAPDMDHLAFIKELLAAGADPNRRMNSSTETRTVFTNQWLVEDGATPFLRAAQSGDLVLMKLLLAHGANPHIPTYINVTPLMVASGIGWVEGVTYEWSPQETYDAVKFLLDLGADVNAQDYVDRRTALMGAAHKGRNDVIMLLVQHGADLSLHDIGSRDTVHALAGVSWQAIDYADGLVRVGVQSAIPHPATSALLRRLMLAQGLPVPPAGRTLASICITDICKSRTP